MTPNFSVNNLGQRQREDTDIWSRQAERLNTAQAQHAERIQHSHGERGQQLWADWLRLGQDLALAACRGHGARDAAAYGVDAAQRLLLTLDTLRERGQQDLDHEAAGTPPVLDYDYEEVVDGRQLPRPVNYRLLRITPPAGVEVMDWKRPYMIIDPRAGHGAGIGGFKHDSQVGVALRAGHPVYFVVFRQHPEPGQTLADVMRAEAGFIQEIRRLHPEAPKPVVVGNCQGGWATLVLAAANPEISGPLVINGAPVATWSGKLGENPMRYNGGLLGGALPALLMSDLGHGEFDGAHLVSNFEQLNPSRNFFGKYFDLYREVDTRRQSFLDFERWWGGFHFSNEAEIRWIVEQLFVGNRLSRGEAQLEPGRHLDLKAIRSPIIVFASRGDNITPPQQALNWIVDTYADEHEIRIRGQRILYMVHDKVGHLGIFVSSSIANKEHAEMASTLKTIETLPPGLYEMTIDAVHGEGHAEHFVVSFHERKLSDISGAEFQDREQEHDFAAVARLSALGTDAYELALRPMVQALVTPQLAQLIRDAHPARTSRRAFADDHNPAMKWLGGLVPQLQAHRQPAAPDNPLLALEQLSAQGLMQGMDLLRDLRDAAYESSFLALYGTPFMQWLGKPFARERIHKDPAELRYLPEVQAMLLGLDNGGYRSTVIRMLILLAESRGSVRRDRLERSAEVLTQREPFASLTPERRAAMIREQSVIIEFEPEAALAALPRLLPQREERVAALQVVEYILGDVREMEPRTVALLQRMRELFELATPITPAPEALTSLEEA
ncbi:alpha/beta fold hydrolase [Roseateles sp.]|uniref:alpha/beta fold hydrolase n=1 Tax=Roseateles sp. TaxID=1971397 RepID=UPI003D1157E6